MQSDNLSVLLIDIETAPSLGWVWEKYETNVIEFQEEWYILSFSVKWLNSKKAEVYTLADFSEFNKDKKSDKQLCIKLLEYLNKADICIAHNGDRFDFKKINARLIVNNLEPSSPFKTIDTLKVAKKHFAFNSNSLNDLGALLGLGKKISTGGFKLWKNCMLGDIKSFKKMGAYNKHDVILLEKIYLKLRPWVANHPNIGINVSRQACHSCASLNTQRRGYSYSKLSKYQRFHCKDCGSWSQGSIEKVLTNGKTNDQ